MFLLVTVRNQLAFGPRILHALLEENNYPVTSLFIGDHFLDPRPLTDAQVRLVAGYVRTSPHRMVGLSLTSYAYLDACRLSAAIRAARPDVTIVWGGHHPTIAAAECVDHADFVCRGEGEAAMLAIAKAISDGRPGDIRAIPGIAYRADDGVIVENEISQLDRDLDSIPAPDFSNRNKLYLYGERLFQVEHDYDDLTEYYMMTSRGCPYRCTFCCVSYMKKMSRGHGTFLRRRSVDSVVEELKLAKQRQPSLRVIYFYDDVFLYDRTWMEEFRDKYTAEIGLPFWCYGYVNLVRDDIVSLMKEAGLYAMSMGIQSGSERVRRHVYARPETDESVLRAAEIINRHGIHITWDLICGPFDEEDDQRRAFELFFKLPKPFSFHFHELSYYRNLEITEAALSRGFITDGDIVGRYSKLTQGITDFESFRNTRAISGDPYWRLLKLFGRADIDDETILRLLEASEEEVLTFIQDYGAARPSHARLFTNDTAPSLQLPAAGRATMSQFPDAPSIGSLESRFEGRARTREDMAPAAGLRVQSENW